MAEADRDIVPEVVFRRTVQYGLANYPEKSRQEQWERFREHMDSKYSQHGYIRLWIQGSPNEKRLRELRQIIENPDRLKAEFDRYYDEQTAQRR